LEKEGVALDDFRVKGMSDLASKGEYRDCYIPVEGLELTDAGPDDLNPGKNKVIIRFSLKKGNYATVLLREIMKN
jgi:tRNA(Glu) U13 pseudouridine synthase TruD